ncbi:hypothetical protein MJO28_007553 [Puccinia striiformis f. sp. tritici]|uniref:Uncharacterized protein n=1 Tax=Puccinia striiformis f. sp. tritici TaxID=168172 RepID=A0ACC0EGG0_9BASI|nr:hypothetical protein MJO28_007553 [Puccinia striiformis f. sp. tritici]
MRRTHKAATLSLALLVFFGEASLSAWWSHHNGSVARSRLSAIRDFGFTFAQQLEYQEFPSAQPTVWFDSQPDFPQPKHVCHSQLKNSLGQANLHLPSAKQLFSRLARIPFFVNRIVGSSTQLFSVKRKLNFLHDKTPRLSLVQTLSYHSNSPLTKPKHVRHSQLKGVVGLANHELLSRLAWTAFSLDLDVTSSIVDRDAETTK